MSAKRALISGITGQDGSYLAELLLERGYEVHGIVRRSSTYSFERIEGILDQLVLHTGDLCDQRSLSDALRAARPDEIYNLAAMSFVAASWSHPVATSDFTGLGVTRMLEATRDVCPDARFYQASSSEVFGNVPITPQNESTPFHPRSPYGVAKAYGHHIAVNYRESYGMYVCSGILFNHASPRQGREFVIRKVAHAAASISLGLQSELNLGTLDTRRDWGYARDYVEMMWSMLQQATPTDYVVGTGESHSVRDVVEVAFDHVGLDPRDHLVLDEALLRPAEVDHLIADPSKARDELGWEPQTSFEDLVRMMVDADRDRLQAQAAAGLV